MSYEQYRADITDDIKSCLEDIGCQPILFIGSGISKRYFGAPNWEQLLIQLSEICPRIEDSFAFYRQTHDFPDIGQIFSRKFREWAWREGKEEFPDELFSNGMSPDIYIKHKIKELLNEITPKDLSEINDDVLLKEIVALQNIRPHALITTNYDQFQEVVFPDYTPIIGQKILRSNHASIGEILKIHGCTNDPASMVLTTDDYEEFITKKKYLSAKLLTYFAEHPLIFMGYRAEDSNIKAILSDIDEIISADNNLIPNIYLLEWDSNVENHSLPAKEKIIAIGEHRSVRVKSIVASSFEWVYEAFAANTALEKVNPKLLRSLLARTYDMVRYDIPKKTVEVNFQILENTLNTEGELAKVYGITTLDNPTAVNASYPYTLTQIGQKLGFASWHQVNKFFEEINKETGQNIKASDNRYHIKLKVGSTIFNKYSEAALELAKQKMNNEPYTLKF
ncbi:SIR2 family protein [Paenibacillus sp. KACC 21273]|uniref:SIR2 family protein n=1 Tax=Paenibacillus sp. KACC 21273 TaxID=3025665 RepID=UPI00236657E9|nr:SIR2 family protein [Paenibacillus sp. KACC 21273]WDF50920.1 SIR2 family protein [Paenibacillus sp. KACC 21273]